MQYETKTHKIHTDKREWFHDMHSEMCPV